jgi:nuclear cap-binding protein subunit 1
MWNCCYGHGGGGVADRAYRKRRRVSENQEIEDRLESLILRVGEKV